MFDLHPLLELFSEFFRKHMGHNLKSFRVYYLGVFRTGFYGVYMGIMENYMETAIV